AENRPAVMERVVDRVEDAPHLLVRRHTKVADRQPPALARARIRAELALFRQVDDEVDLGRDLLRIWPAVQPVVYLKASHHPVSIVSRCGITSSRSPHSC